MTKQIFYTYLGTNGTITSPIHLEDIYYTRRVLLTAEDGKRLTTNGKDFVQSIMVGEEEVENWREV